MGNPNPKISDPSIEIALNTASIRAVVRGVIAYADGPERLQVAVNRVFDQIDDKGDRELLVVALIEMFKFGRVTALRAVHHKNEMRRLAKHLDAAPTA